MILLTSMTDHVVLLSVLLLMIGLARLAYGGRQHEIITTRLNALAAYLLAIRGWGVSLPLGMSAKRLAFM